jgi:hypothetical protein
VALLLSLLVSAGGGILAFIFREELGGFFKPPSPAQHAVNTEQKMAQDAADKPDQAQVEKELRDGSF